MILKPALYVPLSLNSANHKRNVLAVQRTALLARQVNVKSVLTGLRPKMEFANHAQMELISIKKTELAITVWLTALHARTRTFAINVKKDTTYLMELASNVPCSARNAMIKDCVKNVILSLSLLKENVSRLVKITNTFKMANARAAPKIAKLALMETLATPAKMATLSTQLLKNAELAILTTATNALLIPMVEPHVINVKGQEKLLKMKATNIVT